MLTTCDGLTTVTRILLGYIDVNSLFESKNQKMIACSHNNKNFTRLYPVKV